MTPTVSLPSDALEIGNGSNCPAEKIVGTDYFIFGSFYFNTDSLMYRFKISDLSYEINDIGTNMERVRSQTSSTLLVGTGGLDNALSALRKRFVADYTNLSSGLFLEIDL